MAEDNLNEGFTPEQVRNAESIRDSMAGIRQSVTQLNKALDQSGGSLSNASSIFTQIERSAGQVARIQKEATDSAKGTKNALGEQIKNQNIVLTLNQKINDLYNRALELRVQAMKVKKKERQEMLDQADLLERQSKNLAAARDNSQELANTYKSIVDSSTVLDSHTTFFRGLERVVKDIPIIRKLPLGFEEAAKAARQAAKHNLEQSVYLEKIKALKDDELEKGIGLNKQRLEELGLLEITQGKTGTAAAAMLRSYKNSSKQINVMGAGFKVLGTQLKAALGPLLLIDLAVKAVKGLVNLFIGANNQAVDLARSFGTSVDTADQFRERLREVRTLTGNTRNNVEFTIQAAKELTEEFSIVGDLSDDILDSQTFLTRRVGATAQEASKLNLIFAATNQNAKESTKEMNQIVQEFANANGVAVPLKDVISDVSSAGSEIAGYFGFSTRELTQAVIRTRRLGVNLNQAKNIAEGLLNFESSISSELEAELLTGQQFNLERARMLAFTGDIAGATEDVLTQMQNLTEEQRKSPIIMKSMAAATGLSVEELNKAFLIQKNINLQRDEYNRIRYEEGEEAARIALRKAGVEQASIEDMERRITLSEQFQESMTDIKQQFMGLVNGGTIQLLIDSIQGFAEFMNRFFGPSLEEKANRAVEAVQSQGTQNINKDAILQLERQKKEYSDTVGNIMKMYSPLGLLNPVSALTLSRLPGLKQKDLNLKQIKLYEQGKQVNSTDANDFTIRTNPKDTLVMAGGTQFGEETNTLLKELISAVKSGGDVYMDGNKVGQSLVLSTYKST